MNFANARPRSPTFVLLYVARSSRIENAAKIQRDMGNFRRALAMKRSLREMKVIKTGDSCPMVARFFSFARTHVD